MTNIPDGLQHWLEIDLDKLTANLTGIRQKLAPGVGLIAVVKNDAYGFGAPPCAAALLEAGADMLAVTSPEEALELRAYGITAPVLVFLPVQPGEEHIYAEHRLTATVDSLRAAELLCGTGVDCHLKLNTGMNRFGIEPEELAPLLDVLRRDDAPRLTGVYSHLATALEKDQRYAERQITAFDEMRRRIMQAGFADVVFHLANSAGMLRYPQAHFSAVRVGSALYGQLAMAGRYGVELQDPIRACARVAALRRLKKGECVGYGGEFTAPHDMDVAVIPWGYGDGFAVSVDARELTIRDSVQTMSRSIGRLVTGRYQRGVWLDGRLLPVLGRVAMQSMMVDVGGCDVQVGDVVHIPQRKVTTSARLPRVYVQAGEIRQVRSLIAAYRLFARD